LLEQGIFGYMPPHRSLSPLHDIVLGLNWFLNPNAKVEWNLAIDPRASTPPGSSGWTYIFGTRLTLDF
jgi:hypothetical protein